jgi:hypothetical protein
MSAAHHQAAAGEEEARADAHAEEYDPDAERPKETCLRGKGTTGGACWSETSNPTEKHKARAEEHRELAAKHRAAAQALVEAERSACGGIPEQDRDMSPFAHTQDIRSVMRIDVPTNEHSRYGRPELSRAGARITFRAVPGMTVEWLQSVIDCHLARNAALGHDVPEMAYCPLALEGVTALVSSAGNGFAVDVQPENLTTAEEIWRRAKQLGPTQT